MFDVGFSPWRGFFDRRCRQIFVRSFQAMASAEDDDVSDSLAPAIAAIVVSYCSVCTLPTEYCEFGPSPAECKLRASSTDGAAGASLAVHHQLPPVLSHLGRRIFPRRAFGFCSSFIRPQTWPANSMACPFRHSPLRPARQLAPRVRDESPARWEPC